MNSPITMTVGWALVPTRIMRTNNSAGNSPTLPANHPLPAWWRRNHDPAIHRTTTGKTYFAARPRNRTNSSFNHTALATAFPPPHFTWYAFPLMLLSVAARAMNDSASVTSLRFTR